MNPPLPQDVSRIVWNWKDRMAGPRPATVHPVAVLAQAAVALAAATFMVFYKKYLVLGAVLYGLGALVLIGGLFVPPLHRALDRVGKGLGRIVGVAFTWLLLAPFFYLCFPAAHLILKLRGRDPLRRRWEPAAASYWTDRKPVEQATHYDRQF
ncbi:MAG: hypothetical protein NTV49_14660 [Kiritimatiellaeota bacterium]|nr:hypothetical protein [Kiritimatiellota bacterium]